MRLPRVAISDEMGPKVLVDKAECFLFTSWDRSYRPSQVMATGSTTTHLEPRRSAGVATTQARIELARQGVHIPVARMGSPL
jgi:hypothetical protein